MPGPTRTTHGSVFTALCDDPDEAALMAFKARLLHALERYVAEFDTQSEAAEALGISQPRISEIANGRLSKFSTDLLIKYCSRAGLRIPDFDLVPAGN
ncbi:MAG: XRE family transcriptional regulator [Bacteroidota bacterium]